MKRKPVYAYTLESRAIALELSREYPLPFADVHEIVTHAGGFRNVAKVTLETGIAPHIILNALGYD